MVTAAYIYAHHDIHTRTGGSVCNGLNSVLCFIPQQRKNRRFRICQCFCLNEVVIDANHDIDASLQEEEVC